jgi:hypothetical protein
VYGLSLLPQCGISQQNILALCFLLLEVVEVEVVVGVIPLVIIDQEVVEVEVEVYAQLLHQVFYYQTPCL